MKGVLVGLGNPIVGDDSIGIRVVEAIKDSKEIPDNFTIIPDASLGGLPLVELIRGFDKAIIVDAVETRKAPPGSVKILNLSQYENSLHLSDFHNMDFFTALEFARQYYADVPNDITVIGIEIENKFEFSDELSENLAQKFPEIVRKVIEYINISSKEIVANV